MQVMVGKELSKVSLSFLVLMVVCVIGIMPAKAQAPVQGEGGGTVVIDKFVLDQLYSRIERLERDMRGLVRTGAVPPGGGNYPDHGRNAAVAELNIKISQLENELASVTGELEEARHKIDRLSSRLERSQKDTEYRLTELEKGRRGAPSSGAQLDAEFTAGTGGGGPVEADGAATGEAEATASTNGSGFELPDGAPAEQYNYAIGLLRQGAYQDAEQAFRAFLDKHPEDELASNASYWLGETYYVRNQHKEAASAFLSGLKAYPKGNKASQSMLKLGITLVQLGHMEQACATLNEINVRFPDAPTKVKDRANTEREKAGCV